MNWSWGLEIAVTRSLEYRNWASRLIPDVSLRRCAGRTLLVTGGGRPTNRKVHNAEGKTP